MKITNHPSLSYKRNELFINDYNLHSITKDLKTPFYLYSLEALQRNFENFKTEAQSNGLKNPLICYALKANSNIRLLKTLKSLGAGADIVSGGELKQALKAKIPAQKIVFSGVGKNESEIELALTCHPEGIYSFNVESIEELEMISSIAQRLNKTARVALRLNPQVNVKTHKHISTGGKSHKFGILKRDIEQALLKKKLWKSVSLVGLSMHIGSQLTCLKATRKALIELCRLCNSCNQLEFIDVGGGLGVPYNEDHPLSTLSEYMELIAKITQRELKEELRIVFEPGRYIAANCGVLITEVIRSKSSEENKFIIVDGGMNDFVRSSLYGAYHHVLPLKKRPSKLSTCHVVGPICETADSFASNRELPLLKAKDRICIADVGAYGSSMGSTYNMREKTREYIIDLKGEVRR
ncbi:putative diaminopimelate decarboxylase [Halobacteriovorax marinus SJ]|uniref:Diaminopimelate decarboxylase n=1 Tax=Halobacteriovorax marinus (strain ATCC BAA-682 / DSM 15412 / SJ) TaxID=862908 RepID=E1X3R0_HALMS|nr:diaminopimelate decarboxylase [Halobacteriovorax marinus]CBW26989.1 putative diaminopimelate decarboxylase [Halobacteriovorax marinus SJ]